MHVIERQRAGVPVVCVHGFCQSSAYWEPTLDKLTAQGVAALAPDLPGFGQSADVAGPYTMEAYADAIARLLDERGIPRIILAGGSMGGVVAQHFALRHPNRLQRLLLVATGAFTADPQGALVKADALAAADWTMRTVTPVVAGFFHQPQPEERMDVFRRIALSASQSVAVEAARSNARSNTFDSLTNIATQVLIIQGRHDRVRTVEHAAAMQTRLPQCQTAVLEHSGHTPQLEEPDAFHAIALPFLIGHAR